MNTRKAHIAPLAAWMMAALCGAAFAQTPVPDWAIPGSATHKQVPPPKDFHRETVTVELPASFLPPTWKPE